jgi:hypothetical protein
MIHFTKESEMKVQLASNSQRIWEITSHSRLIGRFGMDYMAQIDEVILYPGISELELERVLQLAASHATGYIVDRRRSSSLDESPPQVISEVESKYIMTGLVPPQITSMDAQQLERELQTLDVTIIHAKVDTVDQALTAIVADQRLTNFNITYKLGPVNATRDLLEVLFSVEAPSQFCAWHNVGKPSRDDYDLNIVPAYHPDRADDKTSQWLLNGSTDALIRGEVVRYVYCPDRIPSSRDIFSTWDKVNHPFYAKGSSILLALSPTKILSQEGIDEVLSVLMSLLELEGTYFSVSGGFRGPLDLPHNVAKRQGLRTSLRDGEARGTEGFVCGHM